MAKKRVVAPKSPDLKGKLQATTEELTRIHGLLWKYSKRMLRFGMVSWIFGMATFFSAILIMDVKLLGASFHIWIPLLIVALAVPVVVTAVMIRKFVRRINSLEQLRNDLLSKYEKAILKRVEKMITEG